MLRSAPHAAAQGYTRARFSVARGAAWRCSFTPTCWGRWGWRPGSMAGRRRRAAPRRSTSDSRTRARPTSPRICRRSRRLRPIRWRRRPRRPSPSPSRASGPTSRRRSRRRRRRRRQKPKPEPEVAVPPLPADAGAAGPAARAAQIAREDGRPRQRQAGRAAARRHATWRRRTTAPRWRRARRTPPSRRRESQKHESLPDRGQGQDRRARGSEVRRRSQGARRHAARQPGGRAAQRRQRAGSPVVARAARADAARARADAGDRRPVAAARGGRPARAAVPGGARGPRDPRARTTSKRVKLALTGKDYEYLFGADAEADRRLASKQRSTKQGKFQQRLARVQAALENFIPEVRPGNTDRAQHARGARSRSTSRACTGASTSCGASASSRTGTRCRARARSTSRTCTPRSRWC